jgi:hypothetical protein
MKISSSVFLCQKLSPSSSWSQSWIFPCVVSVSPAGLNSLKVSPLVLTLLTRNLVYLSKDVFNYEQNCSCFDPDYSTVTRVPRIYCTSWNICTKLTAPSPYNAHMQCLFHATQHTSTNCWSQYSNTVAIFGYSVWLSRWHYRQFSHSTVH